MGSPGSTEPTRRPSVPSLQAVVRSPAFAFRNVVLIAGAVTGLVFALSHMVAQHSGFGEAFRTAVTTYVVTFGLFGGLAVLLWGAKYQLRVWDRVRDGFAVSDAAYRDTIEPLLNRAYSLRRILVEVFVAFVLVVLWNVVLRNPVPYAVWVEGYDPYQNVLFSAGVAVDALSVINYLYGVVSLFVIVAGTHGIWYFLTTVERVTELPLSNVEAAAERLEPIARFSVFVATATLIGALSMLFVFSIVQTPWAGASSGVTTQTSGPTSLAVYLEQYGALVLGTLAGIIVVGVATFWYPQMTVHNALTRAKSDRIVAIDDEYEDLVEKCRSESGSPDHLATELEVLEARRRNVQEMRTWTYNLPSLLPFLGSGLVTTVTWAGTVVVELRKLSG